MALKARANRKVAKVGSTLKYSVTVTYSNKTKGAAFDPAGVGITLPTGLSVAKTAVSPRVKAVNGQAYPAPVVAGSTVTFADAPLAGKKRRTYSVWAKISGTATSPLTISAQLANCGAAKADDVTVRPDVMA